jgi:cyclic-di-AMP phosphodiesterase PgpH
MLVVLVVCVGWLRSTQPEVYSKARRKWLLVVLGLLAVAIEALYHYLAVGLNWIPPWLVPFAIPISLATMLAVLMLGPSAALAMGLWSSLSAALIFGRSFEVLLLGLGSSVVAVVLLRNARKRSQVMRAGLAVGLIEGLMALALAAMYQHLPGTFLMQVAVGLSSGVLAAILATLLLPFLEWSFQHTTAISLLELTDMSHPLLQRLALEAPGTYHHSLMAGAIGQAAANRIGADGLLVAVCAYFHDIGKLTKPDFFNENQRSGENPHDSLAPSMSALVIQSHVKEGLTLAKRYKLPRLVCEAICSHHGTTLTSYFYQVAKRAIKESGLAEDSGLEHSFRYDGPKPTTREQAVLMLADTVEAASRSLERTTPNRIAEMVDTLIRDKLLDGQFDHCPLTLADLNEIRASFVFSLTNILHGRNPYPREDHLPQPPKGAETAPHGIQAAGPDAGGPGIPV